MRRSVILAVGAVSVVAATCAIERPRVEDVLAAPPVTQIGAQVGTEVGADTTDRDARAARERAVQNPGDADAQIEAAAALFRAVDARVQRAIADATKKIAADPETTGARLLAIEDQVVIELGGLVLALCDEGRNFAEDALELELEAEQRAAALHQRALHLALGAQAKGPKRALFEGLGGDIVKALEATLAEAPDYDRGAPRVLHGRFRDRAPWPYQDREQAVRELEAASALQPSPLRLLFLGDALFGLGHEYERAVATWRRAARAPADPERDPLAELYRARARARVQLVDDGRI